MARTVKMPGFHPPIRIVAQTHQYGGQARRGRRRMVERVLGEQIRAPRACVAGYPEYREPKEPEGTLEFTVVRPIRDRAADAERLVLSARN